MLTLPAPEGPLRTKSAPRPGVVSPRLAGKFQVLYTVRITHTRAPAEATNPHDSRNDRRSIDLISEQLPFGRLCYGEPNAVSNAIGYPIHRSRSHHAVIRVYDDGKRHRKARARGRVQRVAINSTALLIVHNRLRYGFTQFKSANRTDSSRGELCAHFL
jgi:hypothetical protein